MADALLPVVAPDVFFSVDLRIGTVTEIAPFPEARKPAYQIWVDFGPEIGVRKTSAQVTVAYTPEELLGRRVVGWVNAMPRQIGPFMSEFLLLGVHDDSGAVKLLGVEGVPDGGRVC